MPLSGRVAFRTAVAMAAAALAGVALPACATWRGARLYVEGTDALDRGQPARAVALLERAAELVPERSEVQNHLGLAYQASGREAEALAAFRRAVALDCSNGPAVENLRLAEQRARVRTP